MDAILVMEASGIICYANRLIKKLTGWKAKDLVGKNLSVLMNSHEDSKHPSYIQARKKSSRRAKKGCLSGVDVWLKKKDNSLCKVHIVAKEYPTLDHYCFIGTLTPKEDWSKFDGITEGVVVSNQKGVIEYSNLAFKVLTGYKPSSLVGKNIKLLMPIEFAMKHDQYLKSYDKTGPKRISATGRCVPVIHCSGTVIQCFLKVTASHFEHETKFIGTFISKSNYEEDQDKIIIEGAASLFSEMMTPVIMVTKRGVVKMFNSAAERELGWFAHDIVGENVNVLIPKRYADNHDTFIYEYIRTGKSKVVHTSKILPFSTPDGEEKKYFVSLLERRKDGYPHYWIAVLTKVDSADLI
eukprot:TRINITY_DN6218_c0_g1_i1.p1 TRINITY_DN6218_c0_g1~~TRINITY_DN6218_c0_g1_i1.p1  ORF type:complete len:353 (-),score=67.21 TRINITY_DN6218_c0_g1_i1:203-1261(-)